MERQKNTLTEQEFSRAEILIRSLDTLAFLPRRSSQDEDLMGTLQVAARIGHRLAEIVCANLPCLRTGIIVVEPETYHLRPVAVVGLPPAVEKSWFQRVSHLSLADLLFDATLVERLEADEVLLVDMSDHPTLVDTHAMLVAPIIVGKALVGVIFADHATHEHIYTPEERLSLKGISRIASLVIERDRAERAYERARHDLQSANEQLIQAVKVQSDFISIVSHEFRTTLTGIQGFSELLRENEFSGEEVKEYASDIYADAQRLTHMISELLDIEGMQSGKMELHSQLVDINALLDDAALHARQMTNHHVLLLKHDEKLPLISADREKLAHALANLLNNAIKYSPHGGAITLSCQQEQEMVSISVVDEGIGIPADLLEQIFVPYYRADGQVSHYIKSSGLGLSTVREIVTLHGGRVWVESTIGQGSTFHLTLPLNRH